MSFCLFVCAYENAHIHITEGHNFYPIFYNNSSKINIVSKNGLYVGPIEGAGFSTKRL